MSGNHEAFDVRAVDAITASADDTDRDAGHPPEQQAGVRQTMLDGLR